MRFYSVSDKKFVDVPDKDVSFKMTKNNRKMAMAMKDGRKLVKFVKQ
jgi:hypothetical protein